MGRLGSLASQIRKHSPLQRGALPNWYCVSLTAALFVFSYYSRKSVIFTIDILHLREIHIHNNFKNKYISSSMPKYSQYLENSAVFWSFCTKMLDWGLRNNRCSFIKGAICSFREILIRRESSLITSQHCYEFKLSVPSSGCQFVHQPAFVNTS